MDFLVSGNKIFLFLFNKFAFLENFLRQHLHKEFCSVKDKISKSFASENQIRLERGTICWRHILFLQGFLCFLWKLFLFNHFEILQKPVLCFPWKHKGFWLGFIGWFTKTFLYQFSVNCFSRNKRWAFLWDFPAKKSHEKKRCKSNLFLCQFLWWFSKEILMSSSR